MAENPPLNRIYVLGYSANDRNYPIVSLNADPRVAGYKVPEDLSTCPDKRYPTHVFTGAQPLSGDERVRHVWEILPSPWVPFTRYDDDLGPVQGRRRSVKNEGQVAVLTSDKRTTYEAREGSAIVYTELEETWSIKTDEDGNSLFPIKDRDFYDASRGPVQERRQLFVPTGEEVGSLENVNGVITQTSYEPYNEFLSVKIVQTYSVDGPALVGKATDNDGQLVTVTTQRKGALNYVAPNPTATRTVEVNREDAEALIERVVDTPEIFKANTFSVERPDPIPQKFRVAVPIQSSQEIIEGEAEIPTLEEGEISRSEEQRNKFIKRVSSTSRDQAVLPQTLKGKSTNNERQEVTVTETLQFGNTAETPTATKTVESEALGDGNYVITKTQVDEVFAGQSYRKTKEDLTPQKFRASEIETTAESTIEGQANPSIVLAAGEFAKSEQQINKFVKRISTTSKVVATATTLFESVLTPEGLLATRKLTLANGTQSFVPSATLVDANVEELGDGRTVKTEVTIPNIFEARTVSVERPDPVPQKFRALIPSKTEQINTIGSVDGSIDLDTGEVAKSETQQTQFVKRVSSTSRDKSLLPRSLTQKATSEDRQIATITETLQSNDALETPTATLTVESEAVGDGSYVVRKTEVPEVFSSKVISKDAIDPAPAKFRVAAPTTTEEETVEGTVEEPIMGDGDISKSQQQVNKFVKRLRSTFRNLLNLPKFLEQKATNNQGQLVRVTEILQVGDTEDQPTATKTIESEALGDGTYVVRKSEITNIFTNKSVSAAKTDLTPEKFKANQKETTTQENVIGVVSNNLSLADNEFSKSEEQVTEFVKRTSSTTRNTAITDSLSEFVITPDGQVASRVLTLSKEPQSIDGGATVVDGSIEALGDGRTIKTLTTVDSLLPKQVFSTQRPDPVPQKFRVSIPETTEQETLEGIAQKPDLSVGDLSKSEQQVNKFVKRISTTSRAIPKDEDGKIIPQSLKQVATNEDRQLVTITETFQFGSPQVAPSATTTVESEALGDGTYIVRTSSVGSVFDSKLKTVSRPEVLPEQFRASLLQVTEQEVVAQDSVSLTSLAGNDGEAVDGEDGQESLSDDILEKSEQRIDEYRVRKTTVKRQGSVIPTLKGQDYDPSINITIPFTETITRSGSNLTAAATFVDPLSEKLDLVRKIDIAKVKTQLQKILLSFPTRTSLSLPKVLKSVIIKWDGSAENSKFESDWIGSAVGESWSLSGNESGRAVASASVSPSFEIDMEEIYANNIPTTSYFFFLPYPVTLDQILARVGAAAGGLIPAAVEPWPIFKPRSHVVWAAGKSVKVSVDGSATASASFSQTSTSSDRNQGIGSGSALSVQTTSVTIPPSIHPDIYITEIGTKKFKCKASINIGWSNYINFPSAAAKDSKEAEIEGSNPTKILAVKGPTDIPRSGKYLIDSKVEIYQYGFAKIYAEVLDASIFKD